MSSRSSSVQPPSSDSSGSPRFYLPTPVGGNRGQANNDGNARPRRNLGIRPVAEKRSNPVAGCESSSSSGSSSNGRVKKSNSGLGTLHRFLHLPRSEAVSGPTKGAVTRSISSSGQSNGSAARGDETVNIPMPIFYEAAERVGIVEQKVRTSGKLTSDDNDPGTSRPDEFTGSEFRAGVAPNSVVARFTERTFTRRSSGSLSDSGSDSSTGTCQAPVERGNADAVAVAPQLPETVGKNIAGHPFSCDFEFGVPEPKVFQIGQQPSPLSQQRSVEEVVDALPDPDVVATAAERVGIAETVGENVSVHPPPSCDEGLDMPGPMMLETVQPLGPSPLAANRKEAPVERANADAVAVVPQFPETVGKNIAGYPLSCDVEFGVPEPKVFQIGQQLGPLSQQRSVEEVADALPDPDVVATAAERVGIAVTVGENISVHPPPSCDENLDMPGLMILETEQPPGPSPLAADRKEVAGARTDFDPFAAVTDRAGFINESASHLIEFRSGDVARHSASNSGGKCDGVDVGLPICTSTRTEKPPSSASREADKHKVAGGRSDFDPFAAVTDKAVICENLPYEKDEPNSNLKAQTLDVLLESLWKHMTAEECARMQAMLQLAQAYKERVFTNELLVTEFQERVASKGRTCHLVERRVRQIRNEINESRLTAEKSEREIERCHARRKQAERLNVGEPAIDESRSELHIAQTKLADLVASKAVGERLLWAAEESDVLRARMQEKMASLRTESEEERAAAAKAHENEASNGTFAADAEIAHLQLLHSSKVVELSAMLEAAERRSVALRRERDEAAHELSGKHAESIRFQKDVENAKVEVANLVAEIDDISYRISASPFSELLEMAEALDSDEDEELGYYIQDLRASCRQLQRECALAHKAIAEKEAEAERWQNMTQIYESMNEAEISEGPFVLA